MEGAAARLAEAARQRNLDGFTSLMRPGLSINKKWDWFRCAVTGRLAEFNPEN